MNHFFSLLLLFCFNLAISQGNTDSVQLKSGNDPFESFEIQKDTLLSIWRFNLNTNQIYAGNLGAKAIDLKFRTPDFKVFSSSFFIEDQKHTYFSSKKPYTSAFYTLGSNKGQTFNLLHAQTFGGIQLALNYSKIHSEGFYQHQLIDADKIQLSLRRNPENKRYLFAFSGIYYGIIRQENGGMNDDSLFSIGEYTNSRLYQVYYTDGRSSFTNWQLKADHELILNKPDSAKNKTVSIFQSISYGFHNFLYEGLAQNGYYSSIYKDSVSTTDKSEQEHVTNEIGLKLKFNSTTFSVSHSIGDYRYSNFSLDTTALVQSVNGKFYYENNKIKGSITGTYFLNGFHQGDYLFNANTIISTTSFFDKTGINVSVYSNAPTWNALLYRSNHYEWTNGLRNTNSLGLVGFVRSTKYQLSLEVFYKTVDHALYLDSNSVFQQDQSVFSVAGGQITKNFKMGKKWNFDNKILFQHHRGNDVFRIPDWTINSSVFYSGKAWSMNFNTGVAFNYYSGYTGYAFNPALNSFFLKSGQTVGNYPMLNVFFEARIRTVQVFFSVMHVNEGLFDRNYFVAQDIPMQDRLYRFGIKWNFVN